MIVKKLSDFSAELSNVNNTVVIEQNNDEEHTKLAFINYLLGLESCNIDFKEMLRNNLANIQVKKYYAPFYFIQCMVNDDYRVSYLEEGTTSVHVVIGENEARIDEETLDKVHKEEVVRYERDYNFCCSEYKGPFSSYLINLDLSKYPTRNIEGLEIDVIDKFISLKNLNKSIENKVNQNFRNQKINQAKAYILSQHDEAEYVDCLQNISIIDAQKTIYLVPIFEFVITFNNEQYTSFISGIESFKEYDYPRSGEYLAFNKKAKTNYFLRTILTYLMMVLLPGLGIVVSLFLKEKNILDNSIYLILSLVFGAISIILLVLYALSHKKFKLQKVKLIEKYENSKKQLTTNYFVSLLIVGIIDLIALITGIVLLIIK